MRDRRFAARRGHRLFWRDGPCLRRARHDAQLEHDDGHCESTGPPRSGRRATPHDMKPDFSGEYVLDRGTSALGSGAAAIQSGVVRIEHVDPIFRYRAMFVAGGRTFEYSFERLSDGREVASGENEASSLRWERDELVAIDRKTGPNGHVLMSWRYALEDGGRRLRAVEQIRGSEGDQDNTWIFERR